MGQIRIISGSYGGRSLETPEGLATRPLLSRLRKSLADIMRPRLPGMRLIELFGGSGAISFELLSNGAAHAHVIELDPIAAAIIRRNATKLGAGVEVETGDAIERLTAIVKKGETFDLAIVAPPYGLGLQARAMEALAKTRALKPGGTALVQREASEPQWEPKSRFEAPLTRSYGRTIFDFYRWHG